MAAREAHFSIHHSPQLLPPIHADQNPGLFLAADERRFTYTKTVPPSDFCLLTLGSAADNHR
jgi:hypothetical protein